VESFCSIDKAEQERLLLAQIEYAKENSAYYGKLLRGIDVRSIDDLKLLPFTNADTVISEDRRLVCVPASSVKRIVSADSSSTTGKAKRIYFSEKDIENTVSFFCEGMQLMSRKGDKVAVLMENLSENGISDILSRGLMRFGAVPFCIGIKDSPELLIEKLKKIKPDVIVGMPWQIRLLTLLMPDFSPKAVLLSADYIPDGLPHFIEKRWNCRVLSHYGMTETVYGCAVESMTSRSMLLRKDSFLAECIDESTGMPAEEGKPGQLVLTSLNREAMPLIRYKTGDMAVLDGNGNILRILGRISVHSSYYSLEDSLSSTEGLCDFEIRKNEIRLLLFDDVTPEEKNNIREIAENIIGTMMKNPQFVELYCNKKHAFLLHEGKHVKNMFSV